jgi:hypothetical protein
LDPIKIIDALTRFAGTPIGLILTILLAGWAAIKLDKRYAKTTELEKIVQKWDKKAEALEATGDHIIGNEGQVHEKINKVDQRVSGLEAACRIHHPIPRTGG